MTLKLIERRPSLRNTAFAVLSILMSTIAFHLPAKAEQNQDAEVFVENLASEAIEILGRANFTAQDREAAFRVLFTGSMDVKRIGIFALGQYARTPTPEEKTQYLALVEDFIVKVYASRLSDYTNQVFHVLGSQPKGRRGEEFIVTSQIEFENGREPVPVEWWLLKSEEGFRVFDVKVLGIWMAQEQRSAFISVIRNNNGNFSALLDHIQTRIGEADADIESKLTESDDTAEADDS